MVLVNASSARAVAVSPLATVAPPADTVSPFKLSPVTLKVAAVGPSESLPRTKPVSGASLQEVSV